MCWKEKTLLENLLVFEVEGNFPVYLHEYPQCKDRDFSLNLLPVFHWLIADFRTALGEPLSIRLEMLIGRILSHNYKMHAQRSLCKSSEFRLKSYFEGAVLPSWIPANAEEWAEALISCQMTNESGLLEEGLARWHPQLCTYIGPQHQDRGEPKVTLFDLLMGHYHGIYSSRALQDHRVHLLAGLIQPFEVKSPAVQKEAPCHAITADPAQPYAIYWGTAEKLNSFYLDPKQAQCAIVRNADAVEVTIALPAKQISDSQDTVELSFFMNLNLPQEILIQGAKATTFQLGERIDLLSADLQLSLEILLEKGEGRFFGHILRANRPNQKGKNLKYETYDWQIALRTIRRSEECTLKILLKL